MWYWIFKYVLVGPFLWLLGKPEIKGLEKLPNKGPIILASNHLAVMDSFYLPLMFKRRVTFLAKSEYFTTPGIKGALQKWFYTAVGQIPIDRTNADAAGAALQAGEKVLSENKVLGLYPEGTRSIDGRIYKGKTGVARIALSTQVPVFPVVMEGTNKINPPGKKLLRPGKVKITIGDPLDLSRYEGMAGDRFVERAVTDEIMFDLMKISGQEYVDIYGAVAKKAGME